MSSKLMKKLQGYMSYVNLQFYHDHENFINF